MIPQEKSTVVARALLEAFGTSQVDDVQKMTRGLSSDLVFRIVVRGSPYLLRIMTRMNVTNDPLRVFTCMKAAADAGLAFTTPARRTASPSLTGLTRCTSPWTKRACGFQ